MDAPYSSMPNTFRRDLRAGKSLIGCWASLGSNITTEVLGYAGFDWLLIDGEHAPNDYQSFITQLQALKDSNAEVPEPPPEVAAEYLGRTIGLRFRGRDAR